MAAMLNSVRQNAENVLEYVAECEKLGITIIPPDINYGFVISGVIGTNGTNLTFPISYAGTTAPTTSALRVRQGPTGGGGGGNSDPTFFCVAIFR
jgi:hypothetical protein